MGKIKHVDKQPRANTIESLRSSKNVLYAYIRNSDDHVIYIGLDKKGDTYARHRRHMAPAAKNDQVINRILQSAKPNTYRYETIAILKDETWMEDVEAALIAAFTSVGMCDYNKQQETGTDVANKIADNLERITNE